MNKKSELSTVGQALAVLTTEATKAAVAKTTPGTEAICMSMTGAAGPLMGAAHFASKQREMEEGGKTPEMAVVKVTEDQFFFTCLLMAEICQVDHEGTGCAINFNPTAVATAMDHFQKLTGRDPREFMHHGLVEIADEKPSLNEVDLSKFSRFLPH